MDGRAHKLILCIAVRTEVSNGNSSDSVSSENTFELIPSSRRLHLFHTALLLFRTSLARNIHFCRCLSCECLAVPNKDKGAWRLLLESPPQKRWGMSRVVRLFAVFTAHPSVYPRTEWTMPLPSQPKLVLIFWPRGDGRLSWPRHYSGEQTVCPGLLHMTNIAVVGRSICCASLGMRYCYAERGG